MLIRDYLYIDASRVEDYISSLDPGKIEEIRETFRTSSGKEARGEVKAGVVGGGGGGRAEEELTREQTVKISAQSMFNRVYDELDSTGSILKLLEDQPLELDSLERGQVVEITRDFTPSPINQMIDSLFDLMALMSGFAETEQQLQDEEFKAGIQLMAMLFRGEHREPEVPMVAKNAELGASILFVAKARNIVVELDDLRANLRYSEEYKGLSAEGSQRICSTSLR
jgi:hypothetical protein